MDETDELETDPTRELVETAADERGFHCASDAWAVLRTADGITDEASAGHAVAQLAREKPFLVDPYQQPEPPPMPGTPGPHPKWRLRRRNTNEQMLDILQSGRD